MPKLYRSILLFPAVCLLACGSSKSTSTSQGSSSEVSGTPSAAQSIAPQSYSSKMAQQSSEDAGQQADLSETVSSGTYDAGGTKPWRPGQAVTGFAMSQVPNITVPATADFRGTLNFSGAAEGSQTVAGSCEVDVHHENSTTLEMVLNMNITRTSSKYGDMVSVVTEPNVVVTKVGTRQSGTVTRTVLGTVERTRTGAKDPNRDFDLVLNHNVTVVDTYAASSFELSARTINGVTTVHDKLHNITSVVDHINIERGKPSTCLCPTGGTIKQTITNATGATETHTYVFGGTCGESTVSVDGSAAVAASVTASAGNPNNTVAVSADASATVHATGSLTWAECVPSDS